MQNDAENTNIHSRKRALDESMDDKSSVNTKKQKLHTNTLENECSYFSSESIQDVCKNFIPFPNSLQVWANSDKFKSQNK